MLGTALLAVLLIGVAAGLAARAVALPRLRTVRQLEQIAAYGFADAPLQSVDAPSVGPVARLGGVVARSFGRSRVRSIRKQLVAAGLHNTSVETYLGYYAIAAVGLPLFMIWMAAAGGTTGLLPFLQVGGGVFFGLALPRVVISRRGRLRLDRIDHEMPELVDLLVVGVESGMGLSGAMRLASSKIQGPLSEELRLTLQQQNLGASTTEALENLLDRNDTPAIRSFVRTIVQGERLGVSIGQMMRTLADEMRKHRTTLAQEKAHKTPVKILFPLVFMILPAMFIVLLMPAFYSIGQALNGL